MTSDPLRPSARADQPERWWVVTLLLFSMVTPGLVVPFLGRAPNVSLFDVVLPIAVLYLAARNVLGNTWSSFPDKTIMLLGSAYLAAHLLSMLVNYLDILRGMVAIKIFLFGFVMYWIVTATVRSQRGLERATHSLVLWGAVVAAMLLARFITDWASMIHASYEIKDQVEVFDWARSNYLAALLVPIIPIAMGAAFASYGVKRLAMIIAVALMCVGLLITMSKGAILSLLAGTFCGLPILRKGGLRIRHAAVLVGCAAVLLAIVPTDLITANYGMVAYRMDNPDFNRLDLWRVAWREFVENPILGVGPYCIYIYNRQFAIDDLYSHNFILNVLADLGVIGAIPFLSMIWILLRRCYKSCVTAVSSREPMRWMPVGLFIGVLSTLIHGLVEPTFPGREYSVVFWVCISLVLLYDPRRSPLLYRMRAA